MQIRKTYRYRLYRSKRDKHLIRQIELASEIWNHFVALTRRSRKQQGSNQRRKAVGRVARLHRRIADQRRDFHFKAARAVLEHYDVVAVEDLHLDGMKRLWGRKVSDLGFSEFVGILEHLASANGKQVVKVDRFFASTKTCHTCGWVAESLTLADRAWVCRACGSVHARDVNAAKNIRDRALSRTVGDVSHARHAVAA